MKFCFYKYQGAGNDFILIDNRSMHLQFINTALIAKLCNRRLGIGADGVIMVQEHHGFDFEMVYFNADGKLGSLCGNGSRCAVAFAQYLGIIQYKAYFLAADGLHSASIMQNGDWVSLKMHDVNEIQSYEGAYILDTGSPHFVKYVSQLQHFDVEKHGRHIRYQNKFYLKGINVNFIEEQEDALFVRTYERGVEAETYACGTGVTAAALVTAKYNNRHGLNNVPIKTLGGLLNVSFTYDGKCFREIQLQGPATFVFMGEISI